MRWFVAPDDETFYEVLKGKLRCLAVGVSSTSIEIISKRDALFGVSNDIPVAELEHNSTLVQMHRELLEFLESQDAAPADSTWIGNNYKPHVTKNGKSSLDPGKRAWLTRLLLIERFHCGRKEVVESIRLGSADS